MLGSWLHAHCRLAACLVGDSGRHALLAHAPSWRRQSLPLTSPPHHPLTPAPCALQMKHRLKQSDVHREDGGTDVPPNISFRAISPLGLWVWLQFAGGPPTPGEQELLEGVLRSWFAVGKLGGYNSQNLQVGSRERRCGRRGVGRATGREGAGSGRRYSALCRRQVQHAPVSHGLRAHPSVLNTIQKSPLASRPQHTDFFTHPGHSPLCHVPQVYQNADDDQSFFEYDNDELGVGENRMASYMHDMGDIQYQDDWARVW